MISLKQLVATLVVIVQTRLQLLVSEAQAEQLRLSQLLLFGICAAFFLGCAVLLLTLLVIAILWDTHKLAAIGGFAVLYLGIGIAFGMAARARLAAGSRMFEASIGELQKDRDRLSM